MGDTLNSQREEILKFHAPSGSINEALSKQLQVHESLAISEFVDRNMARFETISSKIEEIKNNFYSKLANRS